ncbi:MAG: Nif3-like dinuclear metal center hexameric protein [Thermodesulfobacteriota bacterium]
MPATVAEIMSVLEKLAPESLAEEWDNVGLAVGDPGAKVTKLWVALDPLPEVVAAAVNDGAQMLLTHHPLIFTPIRNLRFNDPLADTIRLAVTSNLAVACAHTNLDRAAGGVNDVLADRLGLSGQSPLDPEMAIPACISSDSSDDLRPMGWVGELPSPMKLAELARFVRQRLDAPWVRFSGHPEAIVGIVAVCGGSGSSLLHHFFRSRATAFISGDFRYHDARNAQARGRTLVDIGHFASERLVVPALAQMLRDRFTKQGLTVTVKAYEEETDPFIPVA